MGIGVVWAALSGRAENYFAWGMITNLAFAAVFVVSILMRRSAVGLIVQMVYGLPPGWKKTVDGTILAKRSAQASWVWVGVFGLRLAAQVPLYYAGQIVALGTVKLVLGLPLFALAGWLTWVLLRGVIPAVVAEQRDQETPQADEPPRNPDLSQ